MADDRARSRAIDVPTDDVDELVRPADGAYAEENEDHRPNAMFQYGTVDTTEHGGALTDPAEVSPVFARARAANLLGAARALDPDDPTPEELVTLPQGAVTVVGTTKTADDGRDDIEAALRRMADEPVELGGLTQAQRDAAEERDDDEPRSTTSRPAASAPAPAGAAGSKSARKS